jgi:cytochrome c556
MSRIGWTRAGAGLIALAAALLLTDAVEDPADAHTGATGVVKERMQVMGTFADAMKTIKSGVTAKPAIKRDHIVAAARRIAEHADRVPGLFPKGSHGHPSEAHPEIWKSWDGFAKANQAMKAEAVKLAQVAATEDRRTVLGQVVRTARACGACHKTYRRRAR